MTRPQTDEMENTYIDERVFKLLPKLAALAPYKPSQRERGIKNEGLAGWKALAAREARLLMQSYPDDRPESEKEYGTALRQITALKKGLMVAAKSKLKDPQTYHQVTTIITNFGNALSFLFSPYKERQNTRYRETVKVRAQKENRIALDLSPWLLKAHQVLVRVAEGETPLDIEWRDVSCAVALASGRRMAEVHLSAEFSVTLDYKLSFKGQLKGKHRKIEGHSLRSHSFEIPTLLRADLVVKGLEWLEHHGKRFERSEDPERVNRRWSKVLNERAKDWSIIDGMTYHKFRGAYLKASLVNDQIDPFDYLDYARSILGDNDEATIKAYQRFEIQPTSLTRI